MKDKFILVIGFLFILGSAFGAVKFEFEYVDPDGEGFNHEENGWARDVMEEVGEEVGGWLEHDAVVKIEVEGQGILGAGSLFGLAVTHDYKDMSEGGFVWGSVQNKILNGEGNKFSENDGKIKVNLERFRFAHEGEVEKGEFDFKSIVKHELTHVLGFDELGVSLFYRGIGREDGRLNYNAFDAFLVGEDGEVLFDDDGAMDRGFVFGKKVYFDGPNVRAAMDGPVLLHTGDYYEPGSSYSHVGDEKDMLSYSADKGKREEGWSVFVTAVMKDLGYCVSNEHSQDGGGCEREMPRFLKPVYVGVAGLMKDGQAIGIGIAKGVMANYVRVEEHEGYTLLGYVDGEPRHSELSLDMGEEDGVVRMSPLKSGCFVFNEGEVNELGVGVQEAEGEYFVDVGIDVSVDCEVVEKEKNLIVYSTLVVDGGEGVDEANFGMRLDEKGDVVSLEGRGVRKDFLGYGEKDSDVVVLAGEEEIGRFSFKDVAVIKRFEKEYKSEEKVYKIMAKLTKESLVDLKPKVFLSVTEVEEVVKK